MPTSIIRTQALTKTFNAGKPNEVTPVKSVDLTVQKGECLLLKGPSGSGKTTLLTLLACLAKPTAGLYECNGETVSKWSEKFLTRFRRKHIGIVFQQFNLVPHLTAAQNIGLPLYPEHRTPRQIEEAFSQAAAQVNIVHRLNFKTETLSGGEQQRVAIARALVQQPAILFADEPTAHLDTANAQQILALFHDLKQQGKTIILTSHDPAVAQHTLIDRIVTMKDGALDL